MAMAMAMAGWRVTRTTRTEKTTLLYDITIAITRQLAKHALLPAGTDLAILLGYIMGHEIKEHLAMDTWKQQWTVNLEAREATHESGLIVRFTQDSEGWAGDSPNADEWSEKDPAGRSRIAARLMREAGDVFLEKLRESSNNKNRSK